MKVASCLVALVSALAVLAPLSAASTSVVGDQVAVHQRELDVRDTNTCGAGRHRKHHHKKGNKGKAAKNVQPKVNAISSQEQMQNTQTQGTMSAARPSHYYSGTKQSTRPQQGSQASSKAPSTTSSAGATGSTGSSDSSTLSSFAQTMLNMHNADRAKHSAPPLTWSPTLASAAASWAAKCKWQHTPNNPYGQNIAAGTAANFGASDACTMWYDEIAKYNFAQGLYSDATGHFTQMVWKGSRQLGCAVQVCTAQQMGLGSTGSARYVVCNYDPPGNVIGQFLQNVLAT